MPRPKGRPLPEDHKRRISESVRRSLTRKYRGDVMERRNWSYKYIRGQGYLIGEPGRGCIATVADEPTVEQIVADHNQHTALVEQGDRLAQAIRDLRYRHRQKAKEVNFADCGCDDCIFLQPHLNAIDNALATVEQGHEEQVGGGSEG